MKIVKKIDGFSPQVPNCSVTIGNFDGCHLGHQHLVKKAVSQAKQVRSESVAITFSPNPKQFFSKQPAVNLFNERQKSKVLASLGLDYLIIQPFDIPFSKVSHHSFFNKIRRFNTKFLAIGQNFRFGYQRLGDHHYLKSQCAKHGIQLALIQPIDFDNEPISSTRIRKLLQVQGDVTMAKNLLGRPYTITGTIVKGNQLGHQLGFPTANLGQIDQLIPKSGVYCGTTTIQVDNTIIKNRAVFNIGVRPTLEQNDPQLAVEAHLIDFQDGPVLYNKNAEFHFLYRMRDEQKFPSLDTLKAQIKKDINQSKRLLASLD